MAKRHVIVLPKQFFGNNPRYNWNYFEENVILFLLHLPAFPYIFHYFPENGFEKIEKALDTIVKIIGLLDCWKTYKGVQAPLYVSAFGQWTQKLRRELMVCNKDVLRKRVRCVVQFNFLRSYVLLINQENIIHRYVPQVTDQFCHVTTANIFS